MLSRIKSLLKKIRYYLSHESCYKDMEKVGIAVFGICSGIAGGDSSTDYLSYQCITCPYYEYKEK